jgi:hypothetical protein
MRHVVVLALAACGDGGAEVTPVIDVPMNDTASAFPLDTITLSAAHQGNPLDITLKTFTKGQSIALGGIPFGDDLVLHMNGYIGGTDTAAFAYGRTCAFAVDANGALPQPHLYFSRIVKFGQLGFTPLLRVGGTAVTYHDGSGILIGGASPDDPSSAVTDVERFDPSTGEFRLLTTISARIGSVVALLGTGSEALVTIIGGTDPTGAGATLVETIEAENPADSRVGHVDDSSMGRLGLTATTLSSGSIVVIGGSGSGSGCGSQNDPAACVEQITLGSDGSPAVLPAHGSLLHGRWNHTATRLSDEMSAPVLVVGGVGQGSSAPLADVELYHPLTGMFSTFSDPRFMMKHPRSGHQAVLMPDGSLLIIGGIDGNGQPVAALESFTLDGGFADTGTLGSNAGAIDFTATPLPDGRVLITGGRTMPGGAPVPTAFFLAINTNTNMVDTVATNQLTVARAGHNATLLCDGTVLVSGGTPDPQPAERYNPESASRR